MNFTDTLKKTMLTQFLPDIIKNLSVLDEFLIDYIKTIEIKDDEAYISYLLKPKNKKIILYIVAFSDDDMIKRIVSSQPFTEFISILIKTAK